jgi:hypothetical protein
MFTLMPVAAFAADLDAAQVLVNGEEEAVVVAGNDNIVAAVEGTTGSFVYYAVNDDNEGVAISSEIGDNTLTVKTEGDYKVNAIVVPAGNVEDVADVLASLDTVAAKVAKLVKWADDQDLIVGGYAEVSVDAEKQTYELAVVEGNVNDGVLNIKANNGFSKDGKVVVKLVDKNGKAVKGAELKVSKAGYVDVASETLTTDRKGEVELTITSGLANEGNKVIVKYEKAKLELTVNAYTNSVAKVTVEKEPAAPVNIKNTAYHTGVQFKFVDSNGIANNAAPCNIEVVDQPAKAKLEGDDFYLSKTDAKGNTLAKGVYALKADSALTRDGKYTIKVGLENGSSATASFTAKEFDETVTIIFNPEDTPKTVAYGTEINLNGLVLEVDANGVTTACDAALSANGLAVESFKEGKLVVKDDRDYIGSTITVLAKCDDFIATTTLTVVDKAATIAFEDTTVAAGVSETLTGKIVDASNSKTSADLNGAKVSAIVVAKASDNAIAVASARANDGDIELTFLASEAGVYTVQTIVEFADGSYISAVTDITVGAGEKVYNDIVVMSIGATKIVVNSEVKAIDAAPIVENGRTFVPFRALAEAFGATVAFDEATQAVTAELNGTKVVMTIGSAEYTVNGEVKTADVAPFVKDSRTMVPVRFVAEAFGIDVTPVYGENGATVDVLFAK